MAKVGVQFFTRQCSAPAKPYLNPLHANALSDAASALKIPLTTGLLVLLGVATYRKSPGPVCILLQVIQAGS